MSVVTNLIVIDLLNEEQMEVVGEWLYKRYQGVRLRELTEGGDRFGGNKVVEADLYIGAYNHFDLEEFLGFLRGIEWEDLDTLQVLVKEQEDDRFRQVFPEEDADEDYERIWLGGR